MLHTVSYGRFLFGTGPSNSYAGYLTTREEYAEQAYEGCSTLFGPNQLNALEQELVELLGQMQTTPVVTTGLSPVRQQPKRLATVQGIPLPLPMWRTGLGHGEVRVSPAILRRRKGRSEGGMGWRQRYCGVCLRWWVRLVR